MCVTLRKFKKFIQKFMTKVMKTRYFYKLIRAKKVFIYGIYSILKKDPDLLLCGKKEK